MEGIDDAVIARRKKEIEVGLSHHQSPPTVRILQRAQVETDRTEKIARDLHAAYEHAMKMEIDQWEEIALSLDQTDDSEVNSLLESIQSQNIREAIEKSVMAGRLLREETQKLITLSKEGSVELRNTFESLPSLLIGSLNADILPPGNSNLAEAVGGLARQTIGLMPVAGPVIGYLLVLWDWRRARSLIAKRVDEFYFYWQDYIEAVVRWTELANIFQYPPGLAPEEH